MEPLLQLAQQAVLVSYTHCSNVNELISEDYTVGQYHVLLWVNLKPSTSVPTFEWYFDILEAIQQGIPSATPSMLHMMCRVMFAVCLHLNAHPILPDLVGAARCESRIKKHLSRGEEALALQVSSLWREHMNPMEALNRRCDLIRRYIEHKHDYFNMVISLEEMTRLDTIPNVDPQLALAFQQAAESSTYRVDSSSLIEEVDNDMDCLTSLLNASNL